MRTTFGIDRLLADPGKYLKGKRFALLVNQSSVAADGPYLFEALIAQGYKPEKIFAPEHGLFGTEQDQITVADEVDGFTGLKAVSLYGQTKKELKPRASDLEGLDALVVDIQDIGCRYYTYAYTMAFCIEACAALGIEVIICDRPNPLGGVVVEGGVVHKGFESFVGAYPLAVRHSLTIGEVARLLNATEKWNAKLTVIELKNWHRNWLHPQTEGLWVQPSPNMPTVDTAIVYPGTCLFEATNVSEGRGTTRPFEIIGAPFINPKEYAAALNALHLPGVYFRPLYFKPTFHKFKDEACGGVFVHVTDVAGFESFYTGLAMVKTAHDLYPKHFDWRREPYEYVADKLAIDILTGSDAFRILAEQGQSLAEFRIACQNEAEEFRRTVAAFLSYQ
ncbi:MAG: exo-beta-N-acetylmuramidase NamZ family protein [Spirochaetota bacterium]